MTPRDKAIELVNKYLQIYDGRVIEAKQCALIAVDEIINKAICKYSEAVYWQEVKQEICDL
ncbi:hypothetical protein [Brevundimonas sp.]|jgi:hypothetical protein|uniref:hypothetical protein n=1 Tax=Brevundimonas sp. TaxID=1871086 RepID=UPI003783CD7F